jgi:heme/copper-type cytochrome/quinol oxidase subunit 2
MNRFKNLVIILLSLSTFSFVTQPQAVSQETTGKSELREIQVTATKYEFTPNPIHVKKGERVKVVITATDHDHGFELDAFKIDQKIKKGTSSSFEFTADRAGTFPFHCSTFCGFGHPKMKGTLVVEE